MAHEYLSQVERDGEEVLGDLDHARLMYATACEELRAQDEFGQWAARWVYCRFVAKVDRMRWW